MTETPYPNGAQHPAVVRLRSELDAARRGVGSIDELDPEHRARIVADLRTGLPDVASRAAHEIGPEAAVAEIRRFAGIEAHGSEAADLWTEILDTATEAASAASR
jgi:hypothetical protein